MKFIFADNQQKFSAAVAAAEATAAAAEREADRLEAETPRSVAHAELSRRTAEKLRREAAKRRKGVVAAASNKEEAERALREGVEVLSTLSPFKGLDEEVVCREHTTMVSAWRSNGGGLFERTFRYGTPFLEERRLVFLPAAVAGEDKYVLVCARREALGEWVLAEKTWVADANYRAKVHNFVPSGKAGDKILEVVWATHSVAQMTDEELQAIA